MPTKPSACVQDHFADLTDPRRRKVTCPLVNIVEKTGDCPVFARLELQGEHAHAAVFAMAGVNDGPDDSLCLPETLDGPLAGLPPKVTRDPHGVSFRVAGALRVP
jgi:hypothetical protein